MNMNSRRPKKPPVIAENDVQGEIAKVLTQCGFVVKVTSARTTRGLMRVSKGIPDLLIFCPDLPWLYIGLEVKKSRGGAYKPEQEDAIKRLEYGGATCIEEALRHVGSVLLHHLAYESHYLLRLSSALSALETK